MQPDTFTTDYHVHSEYSYCSEDVTIAKLAALAPQRNIKKFFITDHSSHLYFDKETVWQFQYLKNPELVKKAKLNTGKIEEYLSCIRQYTTQGARPGLEVECAFDGDLLLDQAYRDQIQLVIGSIHQLPCLWDKPDLKQLTKEFLYYTDQLLEKDINILGHPTRAFRRAGFEVPDEIIIPVVDKAVEKGIALEINSHGDTKDPDEKFIKYALSVGAHITLGTDTHSLKEFGDFSHHKALLAKCGEKIKNT